MLQITDLLKTVIHPEETKGTDRITDNSRYQANPAPVIVWNITNLCNMTCPHCYASAKIKRSPDDLSHEQALEVIDRLSDGGVRILIFSGGEPMLREDLPELALYARERGISCHLSSNGTLLNETSAKLLKEIGFHYVGVSIDGLEEFNDSYRGLKDGYQKAFTGLEWAGQMGMTRGLRITLSEKNREQLFPLLDIAREKGIERFYISHLVYGGRGEGFAGADVAARENRELMTGIFDRAVELIQAGDPIRLVSGGNDADGVYLHLYIKERFGAEAAAKVREILALRGGNSAGEKVLNIDHKGDVHPDQFWRRELMGNILEESLEQIRNSAIAQKLARREEFITGRCAGCSGFDMCRGSHRERALATYSDPWAEDPACYLTDEEIGAKVVSIAG